MEPYTQRRARTSTRTTREARQTSQAAPQVYYPTHAHLYLGDKTPLYLNWIVEGEDGNLYLVPAEIDGWLHRSIYTGPREQLRSVDRTMGRAIIEMLHVEAGLLQRSS